MNQNHPYIDDIPAYALGALDPDEAAALETHLSTCKTCQAELAAFQKVSEQLLLANAAQTPPARLRGRLLEKLPGRQKPVRARFGWLTGQVGLGLALLILLAMNLFSILQILSLRQQQADLSASNAKGQVAMAMLSSSGTRSIPINSGAVSGSLLLDQKNNTAMLILLNLPELQASQSYQAWLIDPQGKRTSAAIFRPENGQGYTTTQISASAVLSGFSGLGVTVEPAGGSSQPTGQRIFKIDF
ncbi:MAG TPA: anti-sigma factor [Anaerolineales bacterium]|jgi:anti-sigma-K factor RskA